MDTIDQVVSASWHADEAAAYEFFAALHETAALLRADGRTDPDALRAALTDAALPAESVDALIDTLEQIGEPLDEVLEAVVAVGPDDLVGRYNHVLREAYAAAGNDPDGGPDPTGEQQSGPEDPVAEDPDAWNAYLAANGPAWDGTEDTWTQFTDWFLYHGAEAGVGQSAQAFIDYVAAEPDKLAAFAAYGVHLAGPEAITAAAPQAPAPDSGDSDALSEQQISALAEEALADLDSAPPDTETEARPGDAEPAALTQQQISALAEDALADLDGEDAGSGDGFEEGDLTALFGEAGIDDSEPISVEQAVEVVGDNLIKEFRAAHPEFADTSDEELLGFLTEILTEEAAAAS